MDLVHRQAVYLGGKTYVLHRYANGDRWMIIRSSIKITAVKIKEGRFAGRRQWPRTQPSACHHELTPPPVSDPGGGVANPEEESMTVTAQSTEPRALHEIARDIRANWSPVNYGALPYLEAMEGLEKITDVYYAEPASHIVRYFLSNAGTWRGEHARRIKEELKSLL